MLISAAAIKLTLRRAVPERWRLGSGGNTRDGIAIHGMEWQYMEWEEKLDPWLYKRLSRTFAKRWREMSVGLRGGEV